MQELKGKWIKESQFEDESSLKIIDVVGFDDFGYCMLANDSQTKISVQELKNGEWKRPLVGNPYLEDENGESLEGAFPMTDKERQHFLERQRKKEGKEINNNSIFEGNVIITDDEFEHINTKEKPKDVIVDVVFEEECLTEKTIAPNIGNKVITKEKNLVDSLKSLGFDKEEISINVNLKLPIKLSVIENILINSKDIDRTEFMRELLIDSHNEIYESIGNSLCSIIEN